MQKLTNEELINKIKCEYHCLCVREEESIIAEVELLRRLNERDELGKEAENLKCCGNCYRLYNYRINNKQVECEYNGKGGR